MSAVATSSWRRSLRNTQRLWSAKKNNCLRVLYGHPKTWFSFIRFLYCDCLTFAQTHATPPPCPSLPSLFHSQSLKCVPLFLYIPCKISKRDYILVPTFYLNTLQFIKEYVMSVNVYFYFLTKIK